MSDLVEPKSGPDEAARSIRFRPQKLSFGAVGGLFFNFRPAHPLPLQNRRFIALRGAPYGPLATPAQRTQNPPDMSGMKLLPSLSLDQIGHAPRRPERGAVTESFWAFLQALAQLLQLNCLQAGLAARPRRLHQGFGSLFLPSLMPAADRLAVDAQSPGDFPLTEALVKKPGGFEPSPFQLFKITFNAFWITHAQTLARRTERVTILCERQ